MPNRTPHPTVAEQLAEAKVDFSEVWLPGDGPPKKQKYGAEAVHDPEDGWFASRLEHSTWVDLKRRQAAGEISDLQRQVRFPMYVNNIWICDFVADYTFLEERRLIVADAKGKLLPVYLMKYSLMWALYGIRVREYTRRGIAKPRKFRVEP
jgi:hypothetical protein